VRRVLHFCLYALGKVRVRIVCHERTDSAHGALSWSLGRDYSRLQTLHADGLHILSGSEFSCICNVWNERRVTWVYPFTCRHK
jgi:hypothetical protein